LYTVNTKDDSVFAYNEVLKIYTANKPLAKGWYFTTLETGGHGFIYTKEGKAAWDSLFKQLLAQ
jgi:hypothetical protein